MSRTKIALLCVPIAAAGLALAVQASVRVASQERSLAELANAGRTAGSSFVATLQGQHFERQQLAFDRRRDAALALAAARRDRLLGVLLAAGSGLLAAALRVMSRIAEEIEEDRRHLAASRVAEDGPDRS